MQKINISREEVSSMETKKASYKDHEQLVAILCYFVIGIIWFFADSEMHKSKLVRFHSKQMINIAVFNIAITLSSLLIPIIGDYIYSVGGLLLLVLWVIGLIAAVNEERRAVPIIGHMAEQYLKY